MEPEKQFGREKKPVPSLLLLVLLLLRRVLLDDEEPLPFFPRPLDDFLLLRLELLRLEDLLLRFDGRWVGSKLNVGPLEGAGLGAGLGCGLGAALGLDVGNLRGDGLGRGLGKALGFAVGELLGDGLGLGLGKALGCRVGLEERVGAGVNLERLLLDRKLLLDEVVLWDRELFLLRFDEEEPRLPLPRDDDDDVRLFGEYRLSELSLLQLLLPKIFSDHRCCLTWTTLSCVYRSGTETLGAESAPFFAAFVFAAVDKTVAVSFASFPRPPVLLSVALLCERLSLSEFTNDSSSTLPPLVLSIDESRPAS